MSLRTRIALIVLLVSSLTGIGVWSFAQDQVQPRTNDTPIVLSGSDIGFRVNGHKRERSYDPRHVPAFRSLH